MPGIRLHNGDMIVFVGDSITDCGKRQYPPLGLGYVYIFANLLLAKYPEKKINVINAGINGNTILDLKDRWEDDVLSLRPNFISILIGINDIHRALAGQPGYDPESYYRNYREILTLTKESLKDVEILLLSPFYISKATIPGTHRSKVLEVIPKYIEKVELLSKEFSTLYINLHTIFQSLLKHREPTTYAPEPVHPNSAGHMVIALSILNALET